MKNKSNDYSVGIISTALIDKGKRYREDLGDLTDLSHSIKTQGIISPICVLKEGDRFLLLAGERRLTVCEQLGIEEIPANVFTRELNELEIRIVELAENFQRKAMNWDEATKLKREIHALQQKIHGVPTPGPNGTTGWRAVDTANMLGISESSISNAVTLATNMDRLEGIIDFKSMKNVKEAQNKINQISEALLRQELVKRSNKRANSGTFLDELISRYIVGDAIEGLRGVSSGTFDFAHVDPPYGIDLNNIKMANECLNYNEIAHTEYIEFTRDVMKETYRVLKNDTFCVYWYGIQPWAEVVYKIAIEEGFAGSRIPGIWTKPTGQCNNPSSGLANCYETFLVLRKGSPVTARPGMINHFPYPPVSPGHKRHPTEKPLELIEDIIKIFSFENANCVSPFLGSGVDIIAGAECHRKFLGWDMSEEFKGGFIQEASTRFGLI